MEYALTPPSLCTLTNMSNMPNMTSTILGGLGLLGIGINLKGSFNNRSLGFHASISTLNKIIVIAHTIPKYPTYNNERGCEVFLQ